MKGARPAAGVECETRPVTEEPSEELIALASRLFDLARRGETEALAAYVDAGVAPNLANDAGDSLLMLAAYHGHAPLVRALLERGADPDRLNDRGQSPLAGAVFKGEDDVVRALLDGGADPDAGGPTARATAELFGRADLLELMPEPRID
jgi:ankyrin repeat protein